MPELALASPASHSCQRVLTVRDYDLAATLDSGQAFRWRQEHGGWVGVIGSRWVKLVQTGPGIAALTASAPNDWHWLEHYLQTHIELDEVLATFPADEPLRQATLACRGLRLLRQDPWECLASFILSSTKQIVQIRAIVSTLSQRYGDHLEVPAGHAQMWAFPSPARLAELTEAELRDCKMGFRAPYLRETAQMVATGAVNLAQIAGLPLAAARAELLKFPGVGRKIADCVLLFAYGFPTAFPVDVWVMRGLRQLYFPRRRPARQRLERFTETYFGPHAGYAQQYLFHYMRTAESRV